MLDASIADRETATGPIASAMICTHMSELISAAPLATSRRAPGTV